MLNYARTQAVPTCGRRQSAFALATLIAAITIALLAFVGSGTPAYAQTMVPTTTVELTTSTVLASTSALTTTGELTTSNALTTTIAPLPTVALDANGFPADAAKVTPTQLYRTPSRYLNREVTFSCVVSTFAKDSAGDVTAVNCNGADDTSAVLQVDISSFDVTKINPNDTVWFYGVCVGAFAGTNAFGGQVTETGVRATYVNDVTSGYQVSAGNPAGSVAQSSSVAPGTPAATASSTINVRAGPGVDFPVVGQVQAGQQVTITAKNGDATWWQVNLGTQAGWVAASVVSTSGPVDQVPLASNIPTPPPAPPTQLPAPAAPALSKEKPTQELMVGIWGIKLYDVKRAKAVYFFDQATLAQGTYLIPLVSIRSTGSGTAEPADNLDFYLQDDAGNTYAFDDTNNAVLGAAWQFNAGHLYDDINPGLSLGIALPFDVPPSMGDVWLRVNEDPSFAMYLGNVSQMKESK